MSEVEHLFMFMNHFYIPFHKLSACILSLLFSVKFLVYFLLKLRSSFSLKAIILLWKELQIHLPPHFITCLLALFLVIFFSP